VTWQPGDIAVVHRPGAAGLAVTWMQRAAGGHGQWDHAIVGLEPPWIVEAEPGGAVRTEMHYDPADVAWSTGRIRVDGPRREAICAAAVGYVGTPYSWLDYAAIAAHRFRLWAPGLRAYIASTGHMICSQLADRCCADAGLRLFRDGRWPGYVTPDDLGRRIGADRRFGVPKPHGAP